MNETSMPQEELPLAVPTEELSVLVLRERVVFPKVPCGIMLARTSAQNLVKQAITDKMAIVVVCQKDRTIDNPGPDDIYKVGTKAHILEFKENGECLVVLQSSVRVDIQEVISTEPYMRARVSERPQHPIRNTEDMQSLLFDLGNMQRDIIKSMRINAQWILQQFNALNDAESIINYCCANSAEQVKKMQRLLELDNLYERGQEILVALSLQNSFAKTIDDLKKRTDAQISKNQHEYFLNQQMQLIREELGDTNQQRLNELKERAAKIAMPELARERFNTELKRLEHLNPQAPDYSVQEQYLETILSLPWETYTKDNTNLANAQKVLNRDHFGIEKVKERILEFLACPNRQGVILCLFGPPGVGKTSLCKSIADALKREYVRVSLGGMHDEAEIRGHRKTYVGAMPGRIIKNLSKVQSSNPVFVLDEIDKMCNDYHGDPTSALLEVLDPEQNKTFHDNYLDLDYDLSKVLFIATANSLQSVPRPLLDRMELIEMTGYLQEEKEQIAKRYLLPKRMKEQGLSSADMKFTQEAIRTIVNEYTRESGVRELDRQIAAVIRKALKSDALADGKWQKADGKITTATVHTLLGKPRYTKDKYEGNDYTGCVTGLAWTQVGGEILTIETTLFPAKTPTLTLTGNLGDVMKESATIALTYIKAHAPEYGIDAEVFEKNSIHLHVPEGAIPKDGPSAGITMTTAMVSALTNRKVRAKIAMTGEMTLRGRVLPVGGIKEKILAAKQAGITDIILCHENEKDILDIPAEYLKGLTFHYVKDAKEVIDFALL